MEANRVKSKQPHSTYLGASSKLWNSLDEGLASEQHLPEEGWKKHRFGGKGSTLHAYFSSWLCRLQVVDLLQTFHAFQEHHEACVEHTNSTNFSQMASQEQKSRFYQVQNYMVHTCPPCNIVSTSSTVAQTEHTKGLGVHVASLKRMHHYLEAHTVISQLICHSPGKDCLKTCSTDAGPKPCHMNPQICRDTRKHLFARNFTK